MSAVALDNEGNVIVFHRGSHIWDKTSFSDNNTYLQIAVGPIHDDPVVFLDNLTGNIVRSWGSNRYLYTRLQKPGPPKEMIHFDDL